MQFRAAPSGRHADGPADEGLSGTEATAAIRREFPEARIIILTTYEGDADIHRAIAAGARGYLLEVLPNSRLPPSGGSTPDSAPSRRK